MKFKPNKKGLADLEKQVGKQMKKAKADADKATARESTPAGKARAFARELRKNGIEDVDENALRKRFGG